MLQLLVRVEAVLEHVGTIDETGDVAEFVFSTKFGHVSLRITEKRIAPSGQPCVGVWTEHYELLCESHRPFIDIPNDGALGRLLRLVDHLLRNWQRHLILALV